MKLSNIKYYFTLILITFIASACTRIEQGYLSSDDNFDIHMVRSEGALLETGIEYPPAGTDVKGMVLFIRGSGGGDMREYFPGFIDTYLRDVFLEKGYALVFSNKRGIGRSSGNWKKDSSFTVMAEDVIKTAEYYKALNPDLGRKIGLIGHSQGGWIVQRVGGLTKSIDFAVSFVGPVRTLAEQDLYRHRNSLESEGYSEEKVERGMKKRMRTHNMWRKLGGWFPYFELGFMHNIVDDSTAEDLRRIEFPLLLTYGGSDGLVSLEENVTRLNEIFPGGIPRNISLLPDPDSDHYLTIYDKLDNAYETISERMQSESVIRGYTDWLDQNVF